MAGSRRASTEAVPEDVEELSRLHELRRFGILDTPVDEKYDRITALVAQLIDAPASLIGLVDRDRIWFKSSHGLPLKSCDRVPGLCASAIRQVEPYVIEDAENDERSFANPLVYGVTGVRAYAAAPLRTKCGFALGTMGVIDYVPRTFTDAHKTILKVMADTVVELMTLDLIRSNIPALRANVQETIRQLPEGRDGISLHADFLRQLATLAQLAATERESLGVVIYEVRKFLELREHLGADTAQRVMVSIGQRLRRASRSRDLLTQLDDDRFACAIYAADHDRLTKVVRLHQAAVGREGIAVDGDERTPVEIELEPGLAAGVPDSAAHAQDLLRDAERQLPGGLRTGTLPLALYVDSQSNWPEGD